jgi:dTDP-4-amino-4,6-dideoxygalactose transaminase
LRILNSDRDALVKFLNENEIPCGVYYPVPLHAQKAYTHDGYDEADFSVTNQLVKEVISLPMHSELTLDQIEHIANKIKEFLG